MVAEGPPRIVSLVPSLTELLVDLGLVDRLVGRTGYCIHPEQAVGGIPKVGGTKTVNIEKIRRLAPTHLLVNLDENRADTVQALRAFVPHVLETHPLTPGDNLALIDQMVDAFGALPGVRTRATALQQQLGHALAGFAREPVVAQRVLYLIWKDPWMTVARDTYISAMLALIGWQTWPAVTGGPTGAARYPVVDLEAAAAAGVQRVLLSSEPYAFSAADEAELAARMPGARVQHVDGELLSWYGSRAVRGLAALHTLASG